MKKRKVYIMGYSILFLFAFIFIFNRIYSPKIVYFPKIPFSINRGLLILNGGIIWDTGCQQTIFFNNFSNKIKEKKKIKSKYVHDSSNQEKEVYSYFSKELFIDSLKINNIIFDIIEKDKISSKFEEMEVEGILGMNIINKANWNINFSEEMLEVLPHGKKHLYEQENLLLVISYKGGDILKTKLMIGSLLFDDILIDAGSYTEINLLEEDILKINYEKEPIDKAKSSSFSFYQDIIEEVVYKYDALNINGIAFDTINIKESKSRVLGLGFFRKFDKVFFDTKKKKIYCY